MAMGRQRSMPLPPPVHNFTLPRGLEWGKRKSSNGEISAAVHRRSNGPSSEKSLGRRWSEAASPWQSLGSDERGPGVGALHDGQAERGRKLRPGGEDGIAAVRKRLLLDLQAATAKMKEEIIRMGQRDEEQRPAAAGAAKARPPAPTTSPTSIAPAGPSEIARPRNLRTRRSRIKHPKGFAADSGEAKPDSKPENITPIVPSSSTAAAGASALGERPERAKFSVALTRQQIEEDLAAITGHKPSRRPKKRSKNIQKNLDSLFPGLWLTEISANMYKVRDDQ